jgi:hypothetical protein
MSAPIHPVNFFIPPDIQLGLDAGTLVRYGGVVRNDLGQIVTHLKEVDLPGKEPAGAQRAAALLKDRRVVIVIVLGTAIGGTIAFLAVKDRVQARKNRVQARKCIKDLNASLVAYFEAARDGSLDEGTISRLITDLDAAEEYSNNGLVAVASALADLVIDYTSKLAEANSVDLDELQEEGQAAEKGAVVDLRRHLEVQRKIFIEAA